MTAKTEQPTPRRLRRARQQGDTPVSMALAQATALLVAVGLAPAAVSALVAYARRAIEAALQSPSAIPPATQLTTTVLVLALPLVAAVALTTLVVGLLQTGGVVTLRHLAPRLERANPLHGLPGLLSSERWLGLARALLGCVLVAGVGLGWIAGHLGDLQATAARPAAAAWAAGQLAQRLGWIGGGILLALGALDAWGLRHAWWQRLHMSREEVRRERREAEGDPDVKAARTRAGREMVAADTIAAVRDASVVVINPTELATALHYSGADDEAPRVVAQGRGELARKMLQAAQTYAVPVVRDVALARALQQLEVDAPIPASLYEPVAEALREALTPVGQP